MTQHDYLTKMANAIIDDDSAKEFIYIQLSKHPKYNIYGKNPSPMNLADYPSGKEDAWRARITCS